MIGEHIGPYRITRQLGKGGMGVVYEAVHEQLGRRAAIKLLHQRSSEDVEIVGRFFNEARAASTVQHSGVVSVLEFGHLPSGAAYIVMEHLQGETLRARLARLGGRLGPDAIRLGRQLASTMAAVHAAGIVHRDLKPDNIMIVADPEVPGGERTKILDFGIAKLAPDQQDPALRTQSGVMMGTPVYMAPEQCRGSGKVDDRADVYSLGAILYQGLCGRPPFWAEGAGEILAMHQYEQPRPLRVCEPAVSPATAALVHKMLAKDPAERPSMAQVAAGLAALVEQSAPGQGRAARRASAAQPTVISAALPMSSTLGAAAAQTSAVPGRRRRGWVAMLAGTVVLGGGLYAGLMGQGETPEARRAAGMAVSGAQGQRRVRWSIVSRPAGAAVVRSDDGQTLGVTPWQMEQSAAAARVALTLRYEGYVEAGVVLDQDRDEAREVALIPLLAGTKKIRPGGARPRPGKGTRDEKTPSVEFFR